jgi:hypothetical protein
MELKQTIAFIIISLLAFAFVAVLIITGKNSDAPRVRLAKENRERKKSHRNTDVDEFRAFLNSIDIDAAVEKTFNQMKATGIYDALRKYRDEPEAQDILSQIHSTLDSFLSSCSPINLGAPIVRNTYTEWFKTAPQDLINAAKNIGTEVSVYNSIYTMTADYLASGEYHIYRGTLGLEGRDLHTLCLHALDKIVEQGAWSEEMAKEQRSVVSQQIAYVG